MLMLILTLGSAVSAKIEHFNTSHVNVNPNDELKHAGYLQFQYISC